MATKRNIQSIVEDAIVIFLCIAGMTLSLYAFVQELNRALVKFNEEPVATITFKYRSAQRRIDERVLWDRLRQESPIYNLDTIRTAERSEATLHFPDGNSVALSENTMIQVIVHESGARELSLDGGSVVVGGGNAEQGMTLRSGNNTISLAPGSVVSARAVPGYSGVSVQVIDGVVQTADGRRIEAGMSAMFEASSATQVRSTIVVEPAPNRRFLNHGTTSFPVQFRFSAAAETLPDNGYVLQLSASRSFTNPLDHAVSAGDSRMTVPLDSGHWYWRLMDGEAAVEEGAFNILSAPHPVAIAPAPGYEYRFRSRMPAVRFIWTENEYSSFWKLTIADNPGMNNPSVVQQCSHPSSIVSTLSEGTWYWQVEPWYPLNDAGYVGSTPVQRFVITRNAALGTPELVSPRVNDIVNSKPSSGRIMFSWKNNAEADHTLITIADNEAMLNPLVEDSAYSNLYSLDMEQYPLQDGRWYWTVRHADTEGNFSPVSRVGVFYAHSGELIQRALFPPEGYSISLNLAPDTRFTWKTNVATGTRFQVSRTSDFSDTVIDTVQNTDSVSGAGLPEGTWYWRVYAKVGELELTTTPREVSILPALDAPSPVSPRPGSTVVTRAGVSAVFRWQEVEGATGYSLRLHRPASGTTPLYEQNFIEGTEVSINLESFAEGAWYWTVQAYAEETPVSTRRTGLFGRYSYEHKILKPIELVYPPDGIEIDGVTALLEPGRAEWRSVEKPVRARLILSRTPTALSASSVDAGKPLPEQAIVIDNPAALLTLPRLPEGRWWWTVVGQTADGFNITPSQPRSFTVLPIPRLPKTTRIDPADGTRLGPERLSSTRTLRFSWAPVPDATHYRMELRSPKGTVLFSSEPMTETGWELEDLSVLDKGQFRWTVEAIRIVDDGIILQKGEVLRANFSIDIPDVVIPRSRNRRTLYGN